MMVECYSCNKDFPSDLIDQMPMMRGSVNFCLVCTLSSVNDVHDRPKETPFTVSCSQVRFVQAVKHLEETKQGVPAWAKAIVDAELTA